MPWVAISSDCWHNSGCHPPGWGHLEGNHAKPWLASFSPRSKHWNLLRRLGHDGMPIALGRAHRPDMPVKSILTRIVTALSAIGQAFVWLLLRLARFVRFVFRAVSQTCQATGQFLAHLAISV